MDTKNKTSRWSQDTLWATGYKFQKLYCDCAKCMKAANANKGKKGKNK